uniref:peptidylprolyl isomerase n=1 Tax=Alexandrium monilatum TaxID=311494 RepID=A0A6T0QQX2_9DINO
MACVPEQDLLGDGRLLKEVQRVGQGRRPEPGDRIKIHYVCRLVGSDEIIDSSYARGEPFAFTLAEGEVIPGWEEGISSMCCGEQARLTMHPDLAYGSAGCNGGAVPAAGMASISPVDGAAGSGLPSGSLSYEVELLDVGRSPTGEEEDLSPEECLQRAMRAKDAGNTHFKAGDLQLAAETYMGALRLLGHSDTKEGSEELNREQDFRWSDSARREARDRLLLACCLNLTQCELKLDRFLEAFNHATAALGLDPNSSKALYRRGLAALGSGLLDQAKTDLVKAARLEPKNGEIRSQLQACQQRIQESEQKDRSTFGGMFGRGYLYGEKDAGEGREA